MRLRRWAAAAGDLLLGASCPGCDRPGWGLCGSCRTALSGPGYLTRPDPCPPGFPLTATTSPYEAQVKRLVSAHKEHQVLSLTPFLADRLAAAVSCLLQETAGRGEGREQPAVPLVLVPMPSAAAAVRARGFDATWAMTRQAGRSLERVRGGADVARVETRRLLGQSRRVRDQAGLGATARAANLAGSLRLTGTPPAPECLVVIVDDVVTTGSSLAEAARALRRARVRVLGAATVAATVRSRPRESWPS